MIRPYSLEALRADTLKLLMLCNNTVKFNNYNINYYTGMKLEVQLAVLTIKHYMSYLH
jgi:hypothetical protein